MEINRERNLSPLWDELLRIYRIFTDVCNRHKLRHYIIDGCAIGAVRHKGFIPWDDDLDVAMPRPDYDKFMKFAAKELPDNLVAYDRHQCPALKVLFGKVQETREMKVHEVERRIDRILADGLYIDIFPIDGCSDSRIGRTIMRGRFLLLQAVERYRKDVYSHYSVKGKMMWLLGLLCTLVSHRMRALSDFVDAKEQFARQYNYDECKWSMRVPNFSNALLMQDKAIWGAGVKMLFQGEYVVLPIGYDAHLRLQFGDYMKLPPEDKRCSTHVRTDYSPWWLGPAVHNDEGNRKSHTKCV